MMRKFNGRNITLKKIKYSIEHRKVWANIYDTKLDCIMNFWCLYEGDTKKDCEIWLKNYKRGLKNGLTRRNTKTN